MFRFFSLTFIISWACFIAAAKLPTGGDFVFLIGVFAPALVAIWLTGTAEGTAGLQALFSRIFEWRVGLQWYIFAVGYIAAIRLAAALVHRIATSAWPNFSHESLYVIAAAIVLSMPVQAGEEIGWRGYALPRLGVRFGYAGGSVLLGALWAFWHFPVFFILPGNGNYGQSFPLFLVGTTALSVAMAWLYIHTKGSVLLAMLMHSAINQTHNIVQSGFAIVGPFALNTTRISWLTLLFLWIAAAYFLIRMRSMETRLGRGYAGQLRGTLSSRGASGADRS